MDDNYDNVTATIRRNSRGLFVRLISLMRKAEAANDMDLELHISKTLRQAAGELEISSRNDGESLDQAAEVAIHLLLDARSERSEKVAKGKSRASFPAPPPTSEPARHIIAIEPDVVPMAVMRPPDRSETVDSVLDSLLADEAVAESSRTATQRRAPLPDYTPFFPEGERAEKPITSTPSKAVAPSTPTKATPAKRKSPPTESSVQLAEKLLKRKAIKAGKKVRIADGAGGEGGEGQGRGGKGVL